MEINEVKKFVELIKDTDIDELQWESEDSKIALKRSDIPVIEKKDEKKESDGEDGTGKKRLAIKSPMVGTFYRAQSSDHPPLVMEGNHVIPGQKVAVIEAMKIMKDVVSNVKGKITKVLIDDGSPVEYGKELFLVEPEEGNGKSKEQE